MSYKAVYITAGSLEEAEDIAETLVKKRLVACINIIPEIESIYRWKKKIEKSKEVLLIGKTKKGLEKEIIKTIKKKHSYAVPCITFLSVTGGNKEYLEWVSKETAKR